MNKKEMSCYETDASRLVGKAEKVIFPKTPEEVQNIFKTTGLDIVPRGSGTSERGGAIPGNSAVVDMSKMNRVLNFNPGKRIIEVEAGISIKELNEKLNAVNFEFPILSLNESSTLGGMIAVNSSNPRSMKYGKIKDWIEEIEFVNGRGELMKTSKADLGDVCGMEGITGIIASVKLRVMAKTERSASVFQTDNLDEALSISRRLKLEPDIVRLELFPPEVSEMLGLPKKYHLIIEFDSARGKIKGKEYEDILSFRKKACYSLLSNRYYNNEEAKFFFDKLKDFILYLKTNQVPYFGDVGEGTIYTFYRDDEKEKQMQVINLTRKTGGKFTSGIGLKRKNYVDLFEKKIIQRVKLRHDPFGRLNKGKVIDFDARVPAGRHLKPLSRNEVEEIRPLLGEKISSFEIIEKKSPEEKMEEFIEKVGMVEGDLTEVKEEKRQEKPEIRPKDPYSTESLLKDYEYTYESELPKERMTNIEQFAKKIPENIVHESEKKGRLTKEEEDIVKRVMMGNFGKKEDRGEK